METITRLDPDAYRRTPWKNGGGVTVDIADAYVEGAEPGAWNGMLWRLGRTQILTPGPFSDLAGYDRILTVIGGRGLVLTVEGGAALDVRAPFRPVRFRGEDRIVSSLEAGPVAVLNLIADRTKYAIDVEILERGAARPLKVGIGIVYALDESEVLVGDERFRLSEDEALRIDGCARSMQVHGGRVALAAVAAN